MLMFSRVNIQRNVGQLTMHVGNVSSSVSGIIGTCHALIGPGEFLTPTRRLFSCVHACVIVITF